MKKERRKKNGLNTVKCPHHHQRCSQPDITKAIYMPFKILNEYIWATTPFLAFHQPQPMASLCQHTTYIILVVSNNKPSIKSCCLYDDDAITISPFITFSLLTFFSS
mmetsp:Transcript_2685/g.4326  ORF Transcript_2685/g.4326 Transcript_2685/m.4326 type:complete len:107 (+) Transcript_2685:6-326(+)